MGSFGFCIMPVGRIANHYIKQWPRLLLVNPNKFQKCFNNLELFLIAESFFIEFMERAEKVIVCPPEAIFDPMTHFC